MVALYAPKSLDRLIGLVDLGSDSQTSVIKALNEADENGCTGWMEVALYAPKSLDKLISLAETEEQKTSVIKALNKVNKKIAGQAG